jgi:hypothetical protein
LFKVDQRLQLLFHVYKALTDSILPDKHGDNCNKNEHELSGFNKRFSLITPLTALKKAKLGS